MKNIIAKLLYIIPVVNIGIGAIFSASFVITKNVLNYQVVSGSKAKIKRMKYY